MISDNEVLSLLSSEIPELATNGTASSTERLIYQNVKLLADLACSHIKQNDLKLPARIFKVVERLFQEGSQTCKTAVDNIFVFTITTNIGNPTPLDSLMTTHLRQECHRQRYCSGI